MSSATQELLNRLTSSAATSGSISSYHNELQAIRDEGDKSFLFLRTIIDLTSLSSSSSSGNGITLDDRQKEELIFHSILGFRHVMLFRWTKFSNEFRNLCRDYMFALGLNHIKQNQQVDSSSSISQDYMISKTVGNICLATAAAFWKRCWNNTQNNNEAAASSGVTTPAPEEQHLMQLMVQTTNVQIHLLKSTSELFQSVDSILQSDLSTISASTNNNTSSYMSCKGCAFLSNLIGEFSGGGSAVAQYNCSLEFHRVSHLTFEKTIGLLETLRIAMTGLGGIVSHFLANANDSTKIGYKKNEIELASMIVNVTNDVLSWEFGSSGGQWGTASSSSASAAAHSTIISLVRPPELWRECLIRPDFLGAVFQVYTTIRNQSNQNSVANAADAGNGVMMGQLKHSLRQLLLLLSSITGIVFEDKNQRIAYAGFLVDGCLSALSTISTEWSHIATLSPSAPSPSMEQMEEMEKETIDFCCMITKLVSNFKVEGLSQLPSFSNMLTAIASIGDLLLKQHVSELRKVQGDIECVDGYEWRDEALNMLLEAVVLLADDYWLLGVRQGNAQDVAMGTMANTLSTFYSSYVTCRIEMAKMEEHYLTANAADLDEVREEIAVANMEEEMTGMSCSKILLSTSCS